MQNETSYYFSFMYITLLFTAMSAAAILCQKMLKKGMKAGFAVSIFAAFVVLDLAVFTHMALPAFTLPREAVGFNEGKSEMIVPEKRNYKLRVKDQFRYFKPALYEAFTAFDSSMAVHFDKEYIKADLEAMSIEIKDGVFPLQTRAVSSDPEGFIETGLYSFGTWGIEERKAYLGVMEIILEEFALKSQFFFSFPDIKNRTFFIRQGIEAGYSSLDNNTRWEQRDNVISALLSLLRFRSALRDDIEAGQLAFYERVIGQDGEEKAGEIHRYIFYRPDLDISTADLIIDLSDLYRIDDPTFVRFKEYDMMVRLFDPERFYEHLPSVREKLRSDCAISGPVFRFYDKAEYLDKSRYWSMLRSGELSLKTLYVDDIGLFSGWIRPSGGLPANGAGVSDLSYSVNNYGPNRVELFFSSVSEGYLYFSDGYDRYWTVTVDGKNEPLLRANRLFKAVKVSPGEHEAVFRYDPVYFRASLWLYYTVSMLCLAFLVTKKRKCMGGYESK
jgi:hypothetical protein